MTEEYKVLLKNDLLDWAESITGKGLQHLEIAESQSLAIVIPWTLHCLVGKVKLIKHRPLPDGFQIKTVTISRKADGYYVNLSLEDKSVPILTTVVKPTLENTLGID